MKNKLSAILMAVFLMAGCSSGAGTSGGAGGAGTTSTAGGLLLSGSLVLTGSFSVDTILNVCTTAEDGTPLTFEPGFSTTTGSFTINVTEIADLLGGLFPSGITLESYTVTFAAQGDVGAPVLTPRTFFQTVSLLNGASTATVTVIIVDLAFTLPEFAAANPLGEIRSYRVTVTWKGRSLSGDVLVLAASTFIELGNFDRCGDS